MNAYELAKEFLDVTDCETSEYYQAGIMLKQQADRIAELEKVIQECWCGGHSYAYLRAKNRLPQTKPLSDEELNDIAQQSWVYPQGEQAIFNQHKFARAIEERHGIK